MLAFLRLASSHARALSAVVVRAAEVARRLRSQLGKLRHRAGKALRVGGGLDAVPSIVGSQLPEGRKVELLILRALCTEQGAWSVPYGFFLGRGRRGAVSRRTGTEPRLLGANPGRGLVGAPPTPGRRLEPRSTCDSGV